MRTKTQLVVATLILLGGALPTAALAQHAGGGSHAGFHGGAHHGIHGAFHRGRGVVVRGGFGFGFGGWGSYPYGYWYPYYPGAGTVSVYPITYGTVEFKVNPRETRVYVDDRYMGRVDDMYHHKIDLPGGYHEIRLVTPNGATYARKVFVAVGSKVKIDQKL